MADEDILEDVRKRLIETGDWERIARLLRAQLAESGFDDDVKDLAKEKARKQGVPSLAKLVAEVSPAAGDLLSDQVKEAVVREIEAALERIVERV